MADSEFWIWVDEVGDCWLWAGRLNATGYGVFRGGDNATLAHRFAYADMVGPIPPGLDLDHLCRVPACVRPDHLEPVTRAENARRQRADGTGAVAVNAAKTHCPYGHPYDAENTGVWDGRRNCLTCHREKTRAYMRAQREAARGVVHAG